MIRSTARLSVRLLIAAATALVLPAVAVSAQGDSASDSTSRAGKRNLPLEAARSVHVSTDAGTWLSLDVSPDGRTVVFDLLGDLYTVPIGGGTASRITSGLAFDQQPRFSPDGTRLVFVSDRSGGENVWLLDVASGDTTQVTTGNGSTYLSPDWTPDGNYIVASKGEARLGVVKLWMGHVEGGGGQVLIDEPDNLKTVGAAVTPDGRHIWFAQRNGNWQYNAQLPQYQLGVYDRETGQRFTRTSRYGSAFRPTLSADGRWLAYGTRHEVETGIRLRDLASGDERWLAYPVQHDDQESIGDRDVLPGMSFTPDGRELVASYGGRIWRIPVSGGDPIAVPFRVDEDVAVGPEVRFTYPIDDGSTFTVRQIRDAAPSPDGTRIAFTALDRLYLMTLPDGEPRTLTPGELTEAQPAWSPDGRWLAYVTWSPEGGHLWRVRADGRGRPEQLTPQAAIYQQPAWSPDGTRIVAVRGPARAYQEANGPGAQGASDDLVWIPAEGGVPQVIVPAAGRRAPHFTRGSDRIYLSHGQRGLISIRWDGSDEKEHVRVTGTRRPGSERPDRASLIQMAPSGDRALAQVYNDVYVVTVPLIGGETPTISVANPQRAAFPARRLTEVGGQFPTWAADGHTVHWSIGNAFLTYDLDAAKAFDDSVRAARRAAPDSVRGDSAAAGPGRRNAARYEPAEIRVSISVRRDLPQGDLVLRGARIVTMHGDAVLERADLVVHNNRIAAVGATGSVTVPAGARVLDVSGTTIVPGFVDTHAHLRPAFGLHKTQAWAYIVNLAYGVTTTRDPQTGTTDVLTYGDLVDAGQMLGPRIYSTGPGIFGDYVTDPIRDLDHARRIMRRYSEYYDTHYVKMYMAGNRQQRQWVIMAAREQEIMPTTEGGLMFGYNLTMMLDGYPGQEHSLPIYPLYDDVVTLAARTGIAYTPTLIVAYGGPWSENYFYEHENVHDDAKLRRFTPHEEIDRRTRRRGAGWFMDEEYVFPDHAAGVKQIVEAGGRAGVGSHGQLQGLGYHWELWAIQSGGLSTHDALRVATILGAEALGLQNELGSIEGGKLADLLVLERNPLEDIRNTNTIRYVVKNGRVYDGNTLNEVWPTEQTFAVKDWVVDEPATAAGERR